MPYYQLDNIKESNLENKYLNRFRNDLKGEKNISYYFVYTINLHQKLNS